MKPKKKYDAPPSYTDIVARYRTTTPVIQYMHSKFALRIFLPEEFECFLRAIDGVLYVIPALGTHNIPHHILNLERSDQIREKVIDSIIDALANIGP